MTIVMIVMLMVMVMIVVNVLVNFPAVESFYKMSSSSNSSQSIWPVATMKLLSPASKGCPREPTEEVTIVMML